ncbi:hypothetical protein [uncultured Bacteroides sp.]|uniref:hypothetical protein n=1 Tax=uncultured Bacteroides sp. TaxID=162156 RepID=UPI00259AE9B3|nr:hypothetical protein [uncultured Bacteroides sp.]
MQKTILFLLFILNPILFKSQNISSGLYFAAHSAIKEERTSLILSPEFDASKGFTLDFDIKFRSEEHNYGYVFRIIVDNEKSFDLIANITPGKKTLNLIEGDNIYLAFDEELLKQYTWNKWVHIRCSIYPDSLRLVFDNQMLQDRYKPINIKNVKFYFGYSDHNKFHSSDVPPMSIRNIKITDGKNKTIAYWPLKEHQPYSCSDSLHHIPATVTNPTWEINKHTKWVKEKTLELPIYPQICHAPSKGNIYFANSSSVLVYSTTDDTLDTIFSAHGAPYTEINNQLIYHPYYNELWSYDFDTLKWISIFNFKDNTWTRNDREIKNPEYSQHNAFVSPNDSCLYIFGGYGNYQYKNQILKKSRTQDNWKSVTYSEEIPPRYLSGSGYKNRDTILVFGGCGNPQGKQELGIINYYDLYAIDINTFKTKKLWTIPNDTKNFVIGNNIVADEKNNKLYALCFPNDCSNSYILLKSFDLDSGNSCTNYADTIPFTFNDVNSFCTLYYDSLQSQLYAVTNYNHNNKSNINVYSLAYPPLKVEDTLQTGTGRKAILQRSFFFISVGVCIIADIGCIYFCYRRRRKRNFNPNSPVTTNTDRLHETTSEEENYKPKLTVHRKSSILFLDGFQVWDKNGIDITKSFTPILKQLLILIILYSVNNKKGISNVTLRELLWFDKMDESAQNNRRVNIRKLKLLLEKLDGAELVKESTYWSVKFTQTYCDYIEVCNYIDKVKNNEPITATNINDLPLNLLSGQLLPYVQTDWLDSFKSNYANSVLDTAISLSKQEYIKGNNELLIQIANSMFAHDKTDEYALILKCQALYKNGRTSLAKTTFDTFCNEYKAMLNTDYTKTFNEVINCQL